MRADRIQGSAGPRPPQATAQSSEHRARAHRLPIPLDRERPIQGGGDEAIGRSRGGLSTKIHALVDALGNPTGSALSPGQAHDLEGADALLPDLAAGALIADKAFDAEERALRPLEEAGKTAVIPPRANRSNPRPYDRALYKARHLIEVVFTQMTKAHLLAAGAERDDVADLDLAVADQDPVDQQLHQ